MNVFKYLFKFLTGQQFILYFGGGGGGTTQSTGTTYNTNIPEYARPYVETMLGATQKQLFEGKPQQETVTDDYGNQVTRDIPGTYDITGFKPYQAYSTNPADYVAGFSPMQQQAQQAVAGMQVPGSYGAAMDVTGQGIMGAAGTAQQAQGLMGMGRQASMAGQQYVRQATNPYATAAYMSPYMQNVVDVQQQEAMRQSTMQGLGDRAQAVKAGAFGGSRQGLVEAERQRNLATQLGQIQATGLQSAYDKAQANQQFAANLGLQGTQTGAGIMGQGIGAQQAAYNQAMQGAQQYANLGNQAQQAQIGIANLQNQYGAQQQAAEQQKINQAIQDWANTQQYPLMQLGVMSNMLRGLPMQAATTNQYVAAPNPITQGIGTAGAAASLYNAMKAEGGVIKSMASGGIASVPRYDVGGEVADQLEDMPVEQLQREAASSPSPTIRAMAKRILASKQMEQAEVAKDTGPTGPAGVDYQAAPVRAAHGGILAFAEPNAENNFGVTDSGTDKKYDVYNDPEVKAWTSGFMGASKSGDQKSIDFYRGKMEDAITNAQAKAAVENQPQLVAKEERSAPRLTTAEDVARRTPAQQQEQDAIKARIAAEDRRASPAPATAITPAPATATTPVPARAPAAGKKPGIMQAAPEKAAAEPDLLSTLKTERANATKDAERPVEQFYDEQQALREKLGLGEDKAAMEYRKQLMAERANTKDEAERQRWMRSAQFFAAWGSTPGATLAAGLSALQKTIPDMVADKKEQKKVERELDKAMYDIDHSMRLEKKGNVEAAVKAKEKAADRVEKINERVWAYQQGIDVAKEHTKAEGIRASSAAADRAANRSLQEDRYKHDQYRNSLTNQTNVLAEVQREKNSKEYLQLVQDAKIPPKATGEAARRRDAAITRLDEIEKDHTSRVTEAGENVKYFGERAGVPKPKEKAAAPAPEPAKVERPSWVPPNAEKAGDGNWYVREGRSYKKVVQNKE